jgi:hypothetical protein
MKKLLLVNKFVPGLLAVLVVVLAGARPSGAELAVGVGADWVNAPVSETVSLRYDHRPWLLGGEVLGWQGPDKTNGAVVADIDLARWPFDLTFGSWSVDVNLGAAYLAKKTEVNGTQLNFSGRVALNWGEHFRLFLIHFSHGGDTLGIAEDKANDGWNFLGLAYRF